jgi:hypothetical protein
MISKKTRVKNGRLGGQATFEAYGSEHFSTIAKKMHRKRRRLLRIAEKEASVSKR